MQLGSLAVSVLATKDQTLETAFSKMESGALLDF